jgi:hypothetical protein
MAIESGRHADRGAVLQRRGYPPAFTVVWQSRYPTPPKKYADQYNLQREKTIRTISR